MDVLIANNDLMDVVVAMPGVFVMFGFFLVLKTLDTLEQSQVTLQREGLETTNDPNGCHYVEAGNGCSER
jgi:hypothetical protein